MLASNIVLGEASESDSEDEISGGNNIVVDGDNSKQPQKQPNVKNKLIDNSTLQNVPGYRARSEKNIPLLHQTLRSKNGQLRTCLVHVYCHPYESAAKEIDAISQKLIGSQRIIQTVDMSLRKIKRELDQIELMSWPAMISPRWNINDD